MAWCPICNENRQINYRVRGNSVAVPTVSDRYTATGKYDGYEEGQAFKTRIESIPVCSYCNTEFEFPAAQSKQEYFYAKKDLLMKRLHNRIASRPKESGWVFIMAIAWGAGIISGFIIQHISRNSDLAWTLALPIAVGVGILLWKLFKPGQEEKRDEAERESLRHKLEELQAMQFSDMNYQKLRSGQW